MNVSMGWRFWMLVLYVLRPVNERVGSVNWQSGSNAG